LTANSSQVPVECVGILGGQAPTLCREYSPPKSGKKIFVGFRTTFGSFRIRSAISVRSTELRMLRHRNATNVPHRLSGLSRFRPNIAERCRPWLHQQHGGLTSGTRSKDTKRAIGVRFETSGSGAAPCTLGYFGELWPTLRKTCGPSIRGKRRCYRTSQACATPTFRRTSPFSIV
jgi:hypothetical protein